MIDSRSFRRRRSQRLLAVLVLAAGLWCDGKFAATGYAGESFAYALQLQTQLSRREGTLRELLKSLGAAHSIAIQLDPRIDPRTPVKVPDEPLSLLEVLDRLAAYAGATARPLGETVLVTPIADGDRIATLAEIRTSELLADPANRSVLNRLKPFDLASREQPMTPTELLELIAGKVELAEVQPLDHDLWFVDLRGVNAAEAMAFVLVPMGHGFEWSKDGVNLVPLSPVFGVKRSHRVPPGRTPDEVIQLVRTVIAAGDPDFLEGRRVRFLATSAEHDRFARLLSPPQSPSPRNPTEKRFTLRVDRKPAQAVLDSLAQQGVPIGYDTTALDAAGVSLRGVISLDVEQLSAGELAAAIAEKVGAAVELREGKWTLIPGP